MANEVNVPVVEAPGADLGTIVAGSLSHDWIAGDATNKNKFRCIGGEKLIAYNSGVGARTITVQSQPDALNREGDITAYSIAAGKFAVIGPFPLDAWRDSNNDIIVEPEHAEVKFAVIRG